MTTCKGTASDSAPKTLQLREIERKEGENRFSVILAQKRTQQIPPSKKPNVIQPSWITKKLKVSPKTQVVPEDVVKRTAEIKHFSPVHKDKEMTPEWCCSATHVPPNVQYFLASLCDTTWASGSNQLIKARCPYASEVITMMELLESQKTVSPNCYGASVNLTVIKEILKRFRGELLTASLDRVLTETLTTADINSLLRSLHRCTKSLPDATRDFVYLVCRALRTLVSQCEGSKIDSYTELLLNFTPIFFPATMGDLEAFVKASRLLMTLVDHSELIFDGFDNVDINGNHPTLEDDTFYSEILTCLEQLETRLESDESVDEVNVPVDGTNDDNSNFLSVRILKPAKQNFYHLTYVEV